MKGLNRVFALFIILLNIGYFLPMTTKIIISEGGTWGLGIIILPFLLLTHLFLIPAISSWISKDNKPIGFLILNIIGIIWSLFWLWLFLSVPKTDK